MATLKFGRAALCAFVMAAAPVLMGSTGLDTNFEQRVLAAHNRERTASGVGPLKWNNELALGARNWANHLARRRLFEHSPDAPGSLPVGENLWGGTSGAFQPEAMVELWAAEKKHFKRGTFPANSRTGRVQDVGHYTQLIWRTTLEVGCARASGATEDILVCRYSSAGNVVGQTPL